MRGGKVELSSVTESRERATQEGVGALSATEMQRERLDARLQQDGS